MVIEMQSLAEISWDLFLKLYVLLKSSVDYFVDSLDCKKISLISE